MADSVPTDELQLAALSIPIFAAVVGVARDNSYIGINSHLLILLP